MKKITFLFLAFACLLACDETPKENQIVLTDSSGRINSISVVVDNELWRGEVGEVLREYLAAPVAGLPQDEPLFSLSQIPPESFSGFVRKSRNFLKIEKGQMGLEVTKDLYARPQTGIVISGQSQKEIINVIKAEAENIIATFKSAEIKENQRRIRKSLQNNAPLKDSLGVSLKFPTAYRYAVQEDDFFWLRKEIPNGGMNILVFEIPYNTIKKDSNIVSQIIKIRDSIGKKHIPGPTEGTHMITEKAYAPYLFETEIDDRFAYETKGTWEVKGAFMAGPFVNYIVDDKENDRYVVLEGFTFAPSAFKRDNMFELEAILKSAEIE
ncbi:MAG TPA: DUF4837 family protein [Salinimicrobium sp.]|nr:DUF4837 family protein [Salinimicrobium sp.]